MRLKSGQSKAAADKVVKGIRRKTRKHYSAEEKIRVVLAGLRGEESIASLCRQEGISESLYYSWSKEFLEAGKRRLAGDTARQATSPEVKDLRSESAALKEVVAELIPTVIDQNPCAHLRMPRDMIFHGWSMRLFQAWQHSATMSS